MVTKNYNAILPSEFGLHGVKIGKIQEKQLIKYIGHVNYETNEKVCREIAKQQKKSPKDDIYLLVSSPGGPTGAAMNFYDTVRRIHKAEITTLGSGDVDSSGIIIFLTGERRYISRNTTLLLHLCNRRFDSGQCFSSAEIESMAKEDRLKDMQYASVIAENSSLTAGEVLQMMAKNTILTPEEAVSFGLARDIF